MPAKAKPAGHPQRQQPETLRFRSIMPILTVNDIEHSTAWYCDGLGFYLAERWEKSGKLEGVRLKAGACEFGLSQDNFGKGRDRTKGVGFRLWCNTSQDVDAVAARLRAFGGTIAEEPGDRYNEYGFTAQDPDGFKITITQERE